MNAITERRRIQIRQIMRTMKVTLLAIPLSVTLLSSCAHQAPAPPPAAPALPAVFGDGADAKYDRVDNVHQVRFVEIFLVGREAGTGDVVAAVYNTMYTPQGIPASKDTAPQALIEGLNFDHIQKEYGVLGASLNGPKLCLPDWVEIDVGAEREIASKATFIVFIIYLLDSLFYFTGSIFGNVHEPSRISFRGW